MQDEHNVHSTSLILTLKIMQGLRDVLGVSFRLLGANYIASQKTSSITFSSFTGVKVLSSRAECIKKDYKLINIQEHKTKSKQSKKFLPTLSQLMEPKL